MFHRLMLCVLFACFFGQVVVKAQVDGAKGVENGAAVLPAMPFSLVIDSLPDLSALSDEMVQEYANQLANHVEFLENIFNQNALRASYCRKTLEEDLVSLQKKSESPESEMEALKESILDSKSLEKQAYKDYKKATSLTKSMLKLADSKKVAKMRKELPAMRNSIAELAQLAGVNSSEIVAFEKSNRIAYKADLSGTLPNEGAEPKASSGAEEAELSAKTAEVKAESIDVPTAEPTVAKQSSDRDNQGEGTLSAVKMAKYNPKSDVMLNPPAAPCVFLANGKDEFSGQVYKEIQQEEMLRFTHEFMKAQLPEGKAQIQITGGIIQTGDILSMVLTFNIAENNARKSFGGLAKGSGIQIKMLDGTSITLQNFKADEGADAVGGGYVFKAQYPIDRTSEKKLRNTEIDKIRVNWTKGYEDYEIFNIDLFMRQLECF